MKYKILTLLLIIALAALMRFYNFLNFQYFSGDEEIFHAILRRIVVLGKPILVVPNAQIGGSIGSFFHLMSAAIFFITGSNPMLLQLAGSALGIVTTILMYWVGRLMGGELLGMIAATLYGGSYLMSLLDRRWWPLTLDPILILIAMIGLIKLSAKKYKYAILVAVPVSFTWQADPTNALILLAAVVSFIFLKLPLWKKDYLPAAIYLVFSLLPLFLFEIRHPTSLFRPYFLHIVSKLEESSTKIASFNLLQPDQVLENLSRSLIVAPSRFIEEYFCYCQTYPKPPLSPLPELLVILFIAFSIGRGAGLKIIISFFISFLLGISLYNLTFKSSIYQHYFVTVFPTFLLMVAVSLERIVRTRLALLTWIFLGVFLVSNLWTLFNSSMRYPLWQKMELADKVIPLIKDHSFSVWGHGSKYMTDGGWTTFFIRKDHHPARSYLNGGWDWIYRAHSLYTTNPDQGEGARVVIFHDKDNSLEGTSWGEKIERVEQVGNIKATIINNE